MSKSSYGFRKHIALLSLEAEQTINKIFDEDFLADSPKWSEEIPYELRQRIEKKLCKKQLADVDDEMFNIFE